MIFQQYPFIAKKCSIAISPFAVYDETLAHENSYPKNRQAKQKLHSVPFFLGQAKLHGDGGGGAPFSRKGIEKDPLNQFSLLYKITFLLESRAISVSHLTMHLGICITEGTHKLSHKLKYTL